MERDSDFVKPDCLDRTVEHDLAIGDVGTNAFERFGDIARRDRAVELACVRCLPDQLDRLAVDALRRLLGVSAAMSIVFLDPGTVRFEQLEVALVPAPRLLVGQKIVAGDAVIDLYYIADCDQ